MTTVASSSTITSPSKSKSLSISLWVVQVLLALVFGMAGLMKTTAPIDVLAQKMIWPVRYRLRSCASSAHASFWVRSA